MGSDDDRKKRLSPEQEALLKEGLRLVEMHAHKMAPKLRMERDDLESAGREALLELVLEWQPETARRRREAKGEKEPEVTAQPQRARDPHGSAPQHGDPQAPARDQEAPPPLQATRHHLVTGSRARPSLQPSFLPMSLSDRVARLLDLVARGCKASGSIDPPTRSNERICAMDGVSQKDKHTSAEPPGENDAARPADTTELAYVNVNELRPEGDDGTCLRPLGLCELGGCCDVCWYRPDHPRFQNRESGSA